MAKTNVASPTTLFLVMGLEKSETDEPSAGFVLFAGVVAENQARATALFQKKHPNFELMSISTLAEMQDAVKLLTYIQENRDIHDPEFPIPVHREQAKEVDAGQFGL